MSTADIRAQRVVVGFWRRLFADALDSAGLAILGYAFGFAFINAFSRMGVHALWFGLVCSFLYFGILHTRIGDGQTLGKRLLGIQVLKRDGSYLSLGSSLIRYLAISLIFYNGLYGSLLTLLPDRIATAVGAVFLLAVVWAFFACFLLIPMHPLKRGLHDLAAGSVVVYKGRYDAAALDGMENPAKASRALWILTGGTLVIVGLVVAGLITMKKSGELDELSELGATLSRDYDVRAVKVITSNDRAPILSVEVFVPMDRFKTKAQRNQIRADVYERIHAGLPNPDRYSKVQVVVSSGFDLGIASMNWSDK